MIILLGFLIGYLIGSISPSIIVTKLITGNDIRNHGSGNAGATNVMRVLGWKVGVPVFIFDFLKGFFAVIILPNILLSLFQIETNQINIFQLKMICGLSAIIGHIWTIFGNFKGGKGVATTLGFIIAIAPFEFMISLIIFLIVVGIFKFISLGSIISSSAIPVVIFIRKNYFNIEIENYFELLLLTIGISLLIIFTHRKNLKRIKSGTENKFSFSNRKKQI